ncbi:nitrous oxide reductase family maturation protein NosD [Bacillus massiliigorillae]|uniref:nitrous oxide reductase family maturation protein NosD n=1 Tax=Bacillus massiliigorillae TaxID=1243664 RepID=UPI0003A3320D|nr:nitrous oxide reductase family maturation protein NosD [Bacillus massiliigorillae]
MKTVLKGFILLGVIIICTIVPRPTEAVEIKVSPNKQSLQSIIDSAAPGDVIKLAKGKYEGSLIIKKSITLEGEEGAIIDGEGKGHVITVGADDVTIKGLTIQKSGTGKNESAIYLKDGRNNTIENNMIHEVMYGIYVQDGESHHIINNNISSYAVHFSKRGSGIHLYNGEGHEIKKNTIVQVQDGVYLDHTKNIKVKENKVIGSRYGFHFMFSKDIQINQNELVANITGLMIMDSSNVKIIDNSVSRQFHVRGFGILIYDSKSILLQSNKVQQNSTGLSLEKTVDVQINRNVISGNQVGLEFIGENKNNIFTENNFIGNVVQSKITNNKMKLDNGVRGNYWDDYSSYDVTGDGIGEITYKAGSLYDQLLDREPYWQFFFESPSIKLWSKAETLFPSIGVADVYDEKPLVEPVKLSQDSAKTSSERNIGALLLALPFLWFSILVIWSGRRLS